jgi:hypothetical protein
MVGNRVLKKEAGDHPNRGWSHAFWRRECPSTKGMQSGLEVLGKAWNQILLRTSRRSLHRMHLDFGPPELNTINSFDYRPIIFIAALEILSRYITRHSIFKV